MPNIPNLVPIAPKKIEFLKELMTAKDLVGLLYPRSRRIIPEYTDNPKHIVMVPGFGFDTRFFKPLTHFLNKHRHHSYDWGLGINDAGIKRDFKLEDVSDAWNLDATGKAGPINKKELGVPYLCDRATQRIRSLSESLGCKVVVVGWSLGGNVAREAARDLPDHVSQIITFGTPTVGCAKYTATADGFHKQGIDLDWVEGVMLKRDKVKITQPIELIYGRHDGIIHNSACLDEINPKVTTHMINACHIGMVFHYPLWRIILKALSANIETDEHE